MACTGWCGWRWWWGWWRWWGWWGLIYIFWIYPVGTTVPITFLTGTADVTLEHVLTAVTLQALLLEKFVHSLYDTLQTFVHIQPNFLLKRKHFFISLKPIETLGNKPLGDIFPPVILVTIPLSYCGCMCAHTNYGYISNVYQEINNM